MAAAELESGRSWDKVVEGVRMFTAVWREEERRCLKFAWKKKYRAGGDVFRTVLIEPPEGS